jgi:hypothetical protein
MSTEETPPPVAKPAAVDSYEFSQGENRVFAGLARRARSVGFWFIIYGAILLLSFINGVLPLLRAERPVAHIDLGNLVSGLIFLMVGIWSRRSAAGFDAVAKTSGGDIGHLMGALKDLSRLYGLLDRIIFVVVLIMVLVMIVSLVQAVSR